MPIALDPQAAPVAPAPASNEPQVDPNTGLPPPGPVDPNDLATFKPVVDGLLPGIAFPQPKKGRPIPILDRMLGLAPHLVQAGLGFYTPKEKDISGIVYNPKILHEDALKALDKAGALKDVFPPYIAPQMAPVSPTDGLGEAGAGAPLSPPSPAAGTPVTPTSGNSLTKLAAARLAAGAPKDPSGRPLPGQGQLLNGLAARPV